MDEIVSEMAGERLAFSNNLMSRINAGIDLGVMFGSFALTMVPGGSWALAIMQFMAGNMSMEELLWKATTGILITGATALAIKAITRIAGSTSTFVAKYARRKAQCFVAGTLIMFCDGLFRPIECAEVGDFVSNASSNGCLESGECGVIEDVFVSTSNDVWRIHVQTDLTVEVIDCTADHPFAVQGCDQFVPASRLAIGARLISGTHVHAAVTCVERLSGDYTVFNIRVHPQHTYRVTAAGLLVHNADCIPGNPFRGPTAPDRAYEHLKRYHGVDPHKASERLHDIKGAAGIPPKGDVVIGRTGDVYNATTGEWIGSLTR